MSNAWNSFKYYWCPLQLLLETNFNIYIFNASYCSKPLFNPVGIAVTRSSMANATCAGFNAGPINFWLNELIVYVVKYTFTIISEFWPDNIGP